MVTATDTKKGSEHFYQFDGLRGLAIIFVVLCHCRLLIHGGWIVDGIFFTLAGFFLINPYKTDNEKRFLSLWGILRFYKNRAVRILPAYYLILLIVFVHSRYLWIPKETFISLLYFGDIWGTLWFMYAYFWLMFIIPYFMLVLQLLAKKIRVLNNDLFCAAVFFVLAAVFRIIVLLLDIYDIRLEQLFIGISAGYVCRYIRSKEKITSFLEKKHVIGELIVMFIFVLMIFLSSDTVLKSINPEWGDKSVGWKYMFLTACVFSLVIIHLFLDPNGVVSKILSSKIMVFLGKISYTIYLIHIFVMLQINVKSDVIWFLCTFSISVVLAYLIDSAISFVIDKCKMLKEKHAKTQI